MSMYGDIVWVSGSPFLRCLHMPLLKKLFRSANVSVWEYIQSLDESACMETAVELLHSYIKKRESPVNLIGHDIGGTIALIFARQYPEYVKSLILLSVAAQPARTWHIHYYQQRQIYSQNQGEALSNTLHHIFRDNFPCHRDNLHNLMDKFYQDLENIPLMHSLFKIEKLPTGGVPMPLLICGGQIDMILPYPELNEWEKWLKPGDIIWQCPQGSHFFHHFHSQIVSEQISRFLEMQPINIIKKDIVST
ncbi:MAG: alpha/beta hydrolase [Richelia sp.]|nr:alpha/beta hydrolase [Richelia sp.]